MAAIQFVAFVGIVVSLYALYVEHKKEEDSMYVAACDIAEWIACSRVFASEYGKMFSYFGLIPKGSALDMPNAFYGVIFYSFALVHDSLTFLTFRRELMCIGAIVSCALSVWLGYILRYVLHDLCVVCVTTYVLNAALLVLSFRAVCRGDGGKAKPE